MPYRVGAPLDTTIERDRRVVVRVLTFAAGALCASGLWMTLSFLGADVPVLGVDELSTRSSLASVIVDGDLVPESVIREPCSLRFSIERRGFRVPVHLSSCFLSDPLRDVLRDPFKVPMRIQGAMTREGLAARLVVPQIPSCCYCSADARREQLARLRPR
jgi:hypothetical protein